MELVVVVASRSVAFKEVRELLFGIVNRRTLSSRGVFSIDSLVYFVELNLHF